MLEELVIDIDVFIAAISTTDVRQADSVAFLRRAALAVKAGEVRQRQPPLFVLELFAVVNRRSRTSDRKLYPEIVSDPIPTTIESFTEDDAHELQSHHKLAFPEEAPFTKGADLVYLAIARKHGCTLVSWDTGLLKYGERDFCKVIPPTKWLAPGQHAP